MAIIAVPRPLRDKPLEQTFTAMQTNLIEWMFIFSVSHVVIMSGIVFAMLRLFIA